MIYTIVQLLIQVQQAHRDPTDAAYRQCELCPCLWCQEADKALAQFGEVK